MTGYFKDKNDSDFMLVNNNTVKYDLIRSKENVTLCPVDKEASLEKLRAEKVNVKDTYEDSRQQYMSKMWSSMLSTLVMAGVILVISIIEIYLIIRASFLSRVKEVGVYRAIGVKKGDIYRMFMGDIRHHYDRRYAGICADDILHVQDLEDPRISAILFW